MKNIRRLSIVLVLVWCAVASAFAAAPVPDSYQNEVREQEAGAFNRNGVLAFVYKTFFMYDKHVPVEDFLQNLFDKDLSMQFPEATLTSHEDFRKWYAGIGENIKSNTHTVKSVEVDLLGSGTFKVHVVVLWQAESTKGEYLKFLADQSWIVQEDQGRLKIKDYVVKAAND